MDPLSSLLAALVAGAASALKSTSASAITDCYTAVKKMLWERHKGVDLTEIEREPGAPYARAALEHQLRASGATTDSELVAAARLLLAEVVKHDPGLTGVLGVDLQDLRAGRISIDDVISSGSGVRIKHAEATGDVTISGVRAGQRGEPRGKR